MTAYSPGEWETFAAANAGAAAALAGLLFVGVTINVETIVASRRLTDRALEAFMLLTSVLVVSVVLLTPEISTTGLGIALLVIGVLFWLLVSSRHLRTMPRFGGEIDHQAPRGSNAVRIAAGQLATIPTFVAGVSLLAETGGGLYWLVAGILFAYFAALANAWVLLIEIRR
jgi:modulator of FtsH protease